MIYENVFAAHHIAPYVHAGLHDRFGNSYSLDTGPVLREDIERQFDAERAAGADPYIVGLHELAAEYRDDPEAVAVIRGEIQNAFAETVNKIRGGTIEPPTVRNSYLRQMQGYLQDIITGNKNAQVSPGGATPKQNNTPLILAGAAAVALVAIVALR